MRLLAAVLCAVAINVGCYPPRNDAASALHKILDGLTPTRSEQEQAQAATNLKALGTNALPLLVNEMNSFKWRTSEEKDERVIARTKQIRQAFRVLGTNLTPILREFVLSLDTNRNFVSALDGLCAVGNEGVPYLIDALTNGEAAIRLNAVAAVMQVGTNYDVSKLAEPKLLLLLNDQSILVRSFATETLGLICDHPDIAIPALLKLMRTDPELVIRTQGIKAVWRIQTRFGFMNPNVKSTMEEICKLDESGVVRACAERFLADKQP